MAAQRCRPFKKMPPMPSVAHIQDEELNQYVLETLDSARASYIRSHILKCAQCKDRLIGEVVTRLGKLRGYQQSRRSQEDRVLTNSPASLQTLCPLSLERIAVEVVDSSRNGYGLRTTAFLEPGTIVDLRVGTTPAIATVRYCRDLGGHTFHAGVRLQAPTSIAK